MKYTILTSLLTGLTLSSFIAAAKPEPSDPTPTGFIENKGQVHTPAGVAVPAVKYLLPLPGLNVQLRANGFSYDAWRREGNARPKEASPLPWKRGTAPAYRFHRVDVAFVGAQPGARLQTADAGAGASNYYGSYAPQGVTGVQHFGTVTYKNVWPAIDVEFKAQPGGDKPVEYNFILHPGADIADIRLRYEGADAAELRGGVLQLPLGVGTLSESIPASYWADTRQAVDVRYAVLTQDAGSITVGFSSPQVGAKCRLPLVIDPTPNISWGTYYGGADYDAANGTAGDSLGNSYMAGTTSSVSAIATTGAHQTTLATGDIAAFAAKFNSSGVRQWATYYGSTDGEGWDIAVDATGANVYLAGYTGATIGIATSAAYQTTFAGGNYDGFLVRFNSSGVRQWGTYYGGSGNDYCTGISLDAGGNPHVAGATESINAIASTGAHQTAYGGGSGSGDPGDGFVVKFNSSGTRQWATYYGGTDDDYLFGIGVDGTGAVYTSGTALSTTGIATTGAHQATLSGSADAYVVKFNSSGVRQWGTYYGGNDEDYSWELAVQRSTGDVYMCGATSSTSGIATTGAHQTAYGGGSFTYDAFLVRFNSSGVRQWGTYYGGNDDDESRGVALDSAGDVYLGGYTGSSNAISTPGAYQASINQGGYDAFLAKFSSGGTRQWGTYYGGTDEEFVNFHGVAVSGSVGTGTEGIHLSGETYSATGLSTTGAHQALNGSPFDGDGFFTRFTNCVSTTAPPVVTIIASPSAPQCAEVPVTFTATTTGSTAVAYRWLRNGVPVAGATSATYTLALPANGDPISVIASIQGSCGDTLRDTSNVVTVSVLPLPVPVITPAGNVLSTTTFITYKWMLNGTLIPGATTQTHTATASGTYRVIVTASNGCSDTSAPLPFTTSVGDVDGIGAAIRIFPNPASDVLTIESPVAVDAVVSGMDGRVLLREEKASALRLSALADGLYTVCLTDRRTGAVIRVEKVVKRTR